MGLFFSRVDENEPRARLTGGMSVIYEEDLTTGQTQLVALIL